MIKKEKNTKLVPITESTSWRILKFKRPPTVEPESSSAAESHKRAHSETDALLQPSTPKKGKKKNIPTQEEEQEEEKKEEQGEKKKKKKSNNKTHDYFHSPPVLRQKKKTKNTT
ncbi:hypothetical protein EPUS_02797 [Endocarpon pusillum Z07020]|uniref:Uncharacterized protein n=1 Tax=Endocarpon pusillum (strain Z07020 / HMAS-L-300199) TaxID=1263415 RepID=U1G9G6_ENDPU|nr:uncharacterized protein EPUS_02797 [Endocarpon pusillum Z07020]ERF68341.1 hypothetical protein EPUS_02797 [Endocarpon pusillum Z07020]